MDIDFCVKNYLQNYNLLIEQLSYLFKEEEYKALLLNLNNETKDKKWIRGIRFQQQLTDELFEAFIDSKIKLFSHKDENTKKISESFLGEELSLKKVFNNRDDNNKFVLWNYLHLLVLMVELAQKKQNKDRVKRLTKLIEENADKLEKAKVKIEKLNNPVKDPKAMIKEMFNVDLNDQTNEMLNDIIKSFESSLTGNNANPLGGIIDISQKISTKYQEKINSGEIEINKLMEGIQKTIPGMEDILKGNMDGLQSMMGGMMKPEAKKEKVVIDENFSTANVELGKQSDPTNFNVGKLLNLANSFGVLPGGSEGGSMDPQLSELFNMVTSMGSINSADDMEKVKTTMDSFLAKQGIDINKLNAEMDSIMEKSKEKLNQEDSNKKE